MRLSLFAWMLAVIGGLAPVTALAASVSVSDIRFSNERGNNERFKWSVEWAPDSSFDLKVGEEALVIYGALIITDLPMPPAGSRDHDNSFQVAFNISPSAQNVSAQNVSTGKVSARKVSAQGFPKAELSPRSVSVFIDFDNTPQSISFGAGGEVLLTFLDSSVIENSGLYLLTAKVKLISESSPVEAPETESIAATSIPSKIALN